MDLRTNLAVIAATLGRNDSAAHGQAECVELFGSAPEGGGGQAPGRVLDWEGFRELWEQLHPADGIEEVGEEVRFGRNIASETEAPILSVNLVWSGCAVV